MTRDGAGAGAGGTRLALCLALVAAFGCDDPKDLGGEDCGVSFDVACLYLECCVTGCESIHPTFRSECGPIAGGWRACRCDGALQPTVGSADCPASCELVPLLLMEIVVDEGAPVCEPVVGGRCPTLGPASCDSIVSQLKALGHYDDIAPLAAKAKAECP